MAYQYKYDTIHGKAKGTVEVDGDFLVLNGNKIQTSRCRDPKEVGWGALGADYVCESTGVFLSEEKGGLHIQGGAKLTRLLERFPRFASSLKLLALLLLAVSLLVLGFSIYLRTIPNNGSNTSMGGSQGSSTGDYSSLSCTICLLAIVSSLLFLGFVVFVIGMLLHDHQYARQLRIPPLLGDWATRHFGATRPSSWRKTSTRSPTARRSRA